MTKEVSFVDEPTNTEVEFFNSDNILLPSTPEFVEYKSTLMASSLEVDRSEISNALNLGFEDSIKSQIKFEVVTKLADASKDSVLNSVINNEPKEVIESKVLKQRANQFVVDESIVPEVDSFIFGTDEKNVFKEADQLYQHRLESTKRLFAEHLQESSGGIIAGVGYFLDSLISIPKDIIEGGGFTRGNMSEKIRGLISDTTLSEEEFTSKVKEILIEASDVGMFSENNWFYTAQLLENFEQESAAADKVFTVIDAAALGPVQVVKRLLKSRSAVDVVTATKPFDEAVEAAARDALSDTPSPETARHTAPASLNPMKPTMDLAGPDVPALKVIEHNNEVLNILRGLDFGFFIQDDALQLVLPKISQDLAENSIGSNRYLNHNVHIDEGLGNILGIVEFGTTKGTPFKSLSKAEQYAKEIGGKVIEGVSDSKKTYTVRVETNISSKGLPLKTSEDEIASSLFSKVGSTFLTSSRRLDSILKRGEGQLGAVEALVSKEYRKVKRTVPSEDFKVIDKVFLDYRDGIKSDRRKPISLVDFREEFKRVSGRSPSQFTEDAFIKIQELNDATYFFNANRFFREAVDNGESILRLNGSVDLRVRKVTPESVQANRQVYDTDTGRVLTADDLKGKTVYAVNGGYEVENSRYAFVASSNAKERRLFHTDVLDYNPGGPRIYTDMKKFVKQETSISFADGVSLTGRPNTFMGVITENEARLTADELNSLFSSLKNEFNLGGLTKDDLVQVLKSKRNNPDLQALIASSTNFNKNIDDVDDLADFLKTHNLDINKPVSIASDNDLIRTKNSDGIFEYEGGFTSQDETFRDSFIKANNRRSRRDQPLIGYGGEAAQSYTPIEGIERSFTKAINGRSEEAYVFNAVNGWLKGAKPYISNSAEILGMRPYDALKKAKLGDTKEAKAFAQERAVIERRIENHNGFTRTWQSTMENIGDYVYDAGHKKMGISYQNMFSSDPTVALRSLAFDLKLGLFAFPQLIVQSSHAVAIAAIGGKNGMIGAVSYLPIRLALMNGNDSMVKALGKTAGPLLGLEPKQFEELVTFIKTSGRNIIDQTVIEQSQDFNLGLGVVNRVRKAGRVFFNEGELIPRISALTTAYKDFLDKFPGQSINSQEAVLWITNRQDLLSAGMTRASGAAWQKDPLLSVPLQFLSYSSRMAEQIFHKRVLNPGERRRLATMQVAMWGASGYGLGSGLNYLLEEGYIDLNRNSYSLMRYGILDWAIGRSTGARTAFAERLSIGEGFFDLYEKITTDPILEVFGGPSASIAGDVYTSLHQALGNAIHGRFDITTYDLSKVVRNLSSANTAYNSWFLGTVGEYYARNSGTTVASNLGLSEAIFNSLGAPLQDVSLGYDIINIRKREKEHLVDLGRDIQELLNLAKSKFGDGDIEGANNLLEEVAFKTAILNPYQLKQIDRFRKAPTMSMLETIVLQSILNPSQRGSRLADLVSEDFPQIESEDN